VGKGRRSRTLRAGSCGEREKSAGAGRTVKAGALLLTSNGANVLNFFLFGWTRVRVHMSYFAHI